MLTNAQPSAPVRETTLNGDGLSIPLLVAAAHRRVSVSCSRADAVVARVRAAADQVTAAVKSNARIYGVTTGFGAMAGHSVPCELAAASQNNLLSFLAAGAGDPIESHHVRAAMILRANVLLQGCSGVRMEIIERILRLLEADAIPVVRELGSIGASGDLIPLSTIARSMTGGQAKVRYGGQVRDARAVLKELGLPPIELLPKEGLAIVNGTSFSSAIAASATHEAEKLMSLTLVTQSMMLRALQAIEAPFDDFVHQKKPHPGQIWVAKITQRLLTEGITPTDAPTHVQDRYSLRCLPQYLGPIAEGIARVRETVETEMNSVSDNPLIDTQQNTFHQSGNFLGQYVAMAMDDLRRHVGLMAKHLDVQIAMLVTPEFSGGLPPSLRGTSDRPYNMGLKGLQITGNSIMPMLTYLGNPITEHFPTHAEQYNQNINGLSWGSANFAWRSVKLFQQYMAVALIAAVQASDLRAKKQLGHFDGRAILGSLNEPLYVAVCGLLDVQPNEQQPLLLNDDDRWLESDIETLAADIAGDGQIIQAVAEVAQSFGSNFGLEN